MFTRILIPIAIAFVISIPAFAQNNNTALQEEIQKVHAYKAQGNTTPTTDVYQDAKVKLFAKPSTEITYMNTPILQKEAATTQTNAAQANAAQANATQANATQANEAQAATTGTYTRIHRVVDEDTLYNIAKRNCITVHDIQNHNAMRDSNIQIGQALAIPANKCNANTASRPKTTQTTLKTHTKIGVVRQVMPIQTGIKVRASHNRYAVLPKDSLTSIGRRYCVTATEMAEFNNIDVTTAIQPGQLLRLPQKACK